MTHIKEIIDIEMESEYLGRTMRNDNWNCDHWTVTFYYNGRSVSTDFYMGIGLEGREPELYDVLDSLFSDRDLFNDIEDALDLVANYEFSPEGARKAYPELKYVVAQLEFLFDNEIDIVEEHVKEQMM